MPTAPSSHAVLRVSGTDATEFLRAQLTIDVQRLDHERHALAAWCDAKGRVLCTVRAVPDEDGFLLVLDATLAASINRRLRMYVLRARVDITDATPDWAVRGVRPAPAGGPDLPANGKLARLPDGYLLGLNTGDGPGALQLRRRADAETAPPAAGNDWELAEIDAGLPQLNDATSGLFVPQMLNLHWLDAIDFDKGCYPGQEVVARLQYRGRLTRRMFRMHWSGSQPQSGDDVLDGEGAKQGTVIRAAGCGPDNGRLLAVIRVDACDEALTTTGARLELLDLPYPTDEVAVSG